MTIIRPNAYQEVKKLIAILSAILVGVLLFGVFLYLQTVNLRHDIADAHNSLEDMKVENADLKNDLYGMMDSNNLEKLAVERGLVKDKNPQWAFASEL